MRLGRIDLVRLVEQAQNLAEFEEAIAAAARALPADTASIVEFFEIPTADAFDVPPEQAIRYFQAKGLKPTFSYADMMEKAHDHAFTVAKMMQTDMLAQVRASLDSAMANGTPFKAWADEITPILQAGGWWGRKEVVDPLTGQTIVAQLGSPWRLETIFRTNMQSAYAAGAWQEIQAQKEIAPFLMYDAVDDTRTRPLHALWDGRVAPVDSDWWHTHYPPNGYNSIVPDQQVRGHALLGLKAWYAGDVVEVVGASGGRFTVTAQHPVLTTRGWVDAKALREGDELVAYRGEVGGGAVPADQHEHDAPPTIEQVFDALALCARAAVPRAALHLNGDALFFEGDVEVVGADRELVDRLQAAALQFAAKVKLLQAREAARFGARLRALVALALAHVAVARGDRGLQSEAGQAVSAVLQQLGSHRVRFDPVRAQVTSDVLATLAQALPDLAQTHPLFVEAEHFLRDWFADLGALAPAQPVAEQLRGLRAGALDPRIADDAIGGFGVNADAARDITNRHASAVQLDRVASLRTRYYAGHVYDLQTASGTIILHGGTSLPQYVVSNCRCGVIQLSQSEVDAMGLQVTLDPPSDGTFDWTNPRTGEVLFIPKGIDPGFAHNAGESWAWKAKQIEKEKQAALTADMRAAAQKAAKEQAQKISEEGLSAAKALQAEAAAAQAKAALARAQAIAEDKAKQWAAQQQLDAIAKGSKDAVGTGAQYKIKALADLKKAGGASWLEAKPSEQLDQVLGLAADLKSKAALSSSLSLYKKAVLAGKTPSPAAAKAFKTLSPDDQAAFVAKIDAEKAAIAKKAAEEAAAAAQKAAGAQPSVTVQAPDPTPPNTASLVVIGTKTKGSVPGALYQDTETGQKWLVKFPPSEDAVRNEVLAARLYNLTGVEAPELHAISVDGRPALASRIIDGITEVDAATLARTQSVLDGYVVDAWLANWDSVGLTFDNTVLVGGRAVRIDVGGSLRYRAQGGVKGSAFGRYVGEIDSLRDGTNAQARAVFGKITQDELERGAEKVLSVSEADIRSLVARFGPVDDAERALLADTLIARQRDIAQRFPAAAERVRARAAGNQPAARAARVTDAEQRFVEDSRVNGYGFATDGDQIEDHMVVVHTFKRVDGSDATRGFFKLLPAASRDLQRRILQASADALAVPLAGTRDAILAAVKSINFRADKGAALDAVVLSKARTAMAAIDDTLLQLREAADKAKDAGRLNAALNELQEWRSTLADVAASAQLGKQAEKLPRVFDTKAFPDELAFDPMAVTGAPAGIKWKRKTGSYEFGTARFDRSFAAESGRTDVVPGAGVWFEAELADGSRITYFPHDAQVAWAMQGVVKIDAPGKGVASTTRVFGSIDEIGIKSTRASEIDRQHLYLNAFARIRLLRDDAARKDFEAIDDIGSEGVAKKLDLIKRSTGVDVAASDGWRNIEGVRQAFGHGRAYQLRPDLDTPEFNAFARESYLFHNPKSFVEDGGSGVFEKIKPVIEGGGMFASLTDRIRRGVPLGGSSISSDMESGGGEYHFTRIGKRGGGVYGSGIYWSARNLRRMDAVTFGADVFGRTTAGFFEKNRLGQSVDDFRRVTSNRMNETNFKNGLSIFDDVENIVLQSEAEVTDAIAWMQSKGYKTWPDGRNLAEVIITKAKHRAKR